MGKEKKRITDDNYVVPSDRIVFYAKEKHNEFKLCSDLAGALPDHVNIFVEKEKCEKYIQSLNEFADVLHKQSETPIEAINTPNLAQKTILDDIHQHEVDKLVFWEQFKVATDPLDKEIALLSMLQESNIIITKLKSHVQNSTK